MKVYKLPEGDIENVTGAEFAPGCYFNPILDKNGNTIISVQEIDQIENEEFFYLKAPGYLEKIDFVRNDENDDLAV